MLDRLLPVAALTFGLTALAPTASMAGYGPGNPCVTITKDVDGQPWIGDPQFGHALTNETKFYRWIDHDHVCTGEGSYMPPRPSR